MTAARPAPLPASSVQESMWLAERMGPDDGALYNAPMAWRVAGRLDADALRRAVALVIERHEILRTAFVAQDGQLGQLVGEPWTPDVERVDLRDLPEGQRERRAEEWLHEQAERGFDLGSGRPLRLGLVDVESDAQILFLCVHHLAWDAASIGLFLAELRRFYDEVAARPPDRDGERAVAPPPAPFPGRATGTGGARGQVVAAVGPVDCGPVATFAARHGAGVDAVLLATLRVLLSWYSGRWDLTVETAGPSGDPVPRRLRSRPEQSFRSLVVDSAAELARGATPAAPDTAPDAAGDPRQVTVLFGYDEDAPPGADAAASGQGHHDLRLWLSRHGGELRGQFGVDGRRFDAELAATLADHYARLLGEVVADPEARIGRFEPLSERERRTQLRDWNDTGANFPDATLHELVRARARTQPDAVALVAGDQRRTYRELVERAEAVARGLVASGVRPGEFVALALDRGTAQVEAILAVLLAGAAYVPIDTALPGERMAFMLGDCGSRWMVTGDGGAPDGAAGNGDVHAVTLDQLAERGTERGTERVALPDVAATAPAYCIYTSGTTGRPKGVVVSHRNVVRLVDSDRLPFAFGPDDVWTMFHSYSFDVSVWEVFCCLVHGGRLVTVTRDVARDAQRFWEVVTRERATVVCQTPSAFAQLALAAHDDGLAGHLRYLILAGEKLLPRLVEPWLERRPGLQVVNMYGPTEASVYATARFVTAEDARDVSNIGTPIASTTLYLLDPDTRARLLPVGSVGEIHLGGEGIAAGYVGRPDLDAERFVPDPFGGGRLYRTGDFGRYLPDGSVEYLGRRDSQVKLRGYRVELEEIASCLREHPAVRDAVVVVDGDDGNLVGYVRPRGDGAGVAELRAYLRGRLPEYMVPARLHAMDRRPLTENGKLDHSALRELARPLDGTASRQATTATARALGEIWSELLGIDAPADDAEFFDSGGHSLLVFKLVTRVKARLGVSLRLRDVFECPRLGDLARRVDAVAGNEPAPEETPAAAGPDGPEDAPLPYRDFVRHQLDWRASPDGAADVEHWVSRLDGAPSFLSLAPPRRVEEHGTVPVPLPDDLLDRLADLRTDHGVSWFMAAAAALAATLHRWTDDEDVVFGTPISIRDERHAGVLGPCLNTVVLRSTCTEQSSVGDLLRGARETVLEAFEHAEAPFEAVVDRLNPPRRPGWTPYLDVALVADTLPAQPPTLGGMALTALPFSGVDHLAKFGLTAALVEQGGRLTATVHYRGDRFTRAEVERMSRWFGRLLDRLPDVLDVPLHTLDLLDADDRAELAGFEWGGPATPPATVPELVARQCARRPDATAVVSARGETTYRELDARVRALAGLLRPSVRGDTPVVAVSLPRGEDLVVAMLAAWRAGCAFCPLEPGYPFSRVDYILDDLDACAVLTDDPGLAGHLSTRDVPVLGVRDVAAADTASGEVTAPDRDSLAYVLYTSGTTGEPKGVGYSHGSIADVTTWHVREFGFGPAERVSQIHSVAFDVTQWELWPALCSGATVLPYEQQVLAPELAAWLAARTVTALFAPTPLAETLWAEGTDLPGLRWMFFAGSALSQPPPDTRTYQLCNGYGPTESFITTTRVIPPGSAGPLNCIGRPVAGNHVYVLDRSGGRVPVGFPGEIHVAGASVSPGYWRRPAITRERFSGTDPDGRPSWVYRTGDRGRWLPDGTLEFLGRADRQLKVRGYRIEPQEIEAHLHGDPLVRQAVVHATGSGPLVGYVVAAEGAEPDTRAVLARLRVRLPAFMLPDAIVWLDGFPMTSRGKVDTRRLPRPGRDEMVGGVAPVAPATDLERRIAAVWCEVLGVDAVGVHDNFFDLGGNSLLLARLHSRLQAEIGTALPIRLLFEFPTVATLAAGLADPDGTPPALPGGEDPRARAERARLARASRAAPRRRVTP